MDISIKELKYFVAIAEKKHFGKAAYSVNVSQPTLSMQFKKLEDRLGVKLVERLPKEAILTQLGEEILPLARQVLSTISIIHQRCGKNEVNKRFRLGVIPTISPYLIPKIDKALSQGFGGRKVSLIESQTKELINLIKDGALDAAILSTPIVEKGLEEIEIFDEPFFLAVNKSHRLAQKKKVSLSDLRNEKLLLLGEGHCLRNQALEICSLPQTDNNIDLTATSIETLRSMIAVGEGVTLIPKLAVKRSGNVTYLPLAESSAKRSIGIIYRRSFYDSETIDSLVSIIKNAAIRDGMHLVRSH
jgi:LysR family transcriptional regulator, hydrogen peroxide-inducible genes activator